MRKKGKKYPNPYKIYSSFDVDKLKREAEKNPDDEKLKERLEYVLKYNKNRPNIDASHFRLPGSYGSKK